MPTADIQALLARFDYTDGVYLRDEMDIAVAQREAITPHLIALLDDLADNPLRYTLEGRNGHVYAVSLLSHFRETAAHRAIIRAFTVPREQLEELWGDMITETLPTLLHRTCGGSLDRIRALVVDREVDPFVRGAAIEALTFAVAEGVADRDETVAFVQGLFTGEEAEADSFFWSNLVATLCDLHPGDSMELIRRAYADNLVQQDYIAPEDVERSLAMDRAEAMDALRERTRRRMPADLHRYISWFAEFQPKEDRPPASTDREAARARQADRKKQAERARNKAAKKARKKNRR
ncbi:MAG: DUF1186 domain-containing protein [Desulfobulbus sp.]|uniref:DUF1186 domain-containing protein n=1 Tax=uncultured Desulfobulbus sp. TaxID=239745 RepID=UPI001B5F9E5A|nr:DUF1186 domain-containing protein [uncultured Desulfobulbus sp.]MBP7517594.1 DUF1186 domain-containing protein [Desulfobulbus sp.]